MQVAPTYGTTATPEAAEKAHGTASGELTAAPTGGLAAAPTFATSPPSSQHSGSAARPLTPEEIVYASKFFGSTIDYGSVRIVKGSGGNLVAEIAFKKGNPAITLSSTIYIKEGYSIDFSKPGADASLFMHEMTHIWQYSKLTVPGFFGQYATELTASGFAPAKMYDYKTGTTPFAAAMLEAQAAMVGDYHETSNAGVRKLIEDNLESSPWNPKAAKQKNVPANPAGGSSAK